MKNLKPTHGIFDTKLELKGKELAIFFLNYLIPGGDSPTPGRVCVCVWGGGGGGGGGHYRCIFMDTSTLLFYILFQIIYLQCLHSFKFSLH